MASSPAELPLATWAPSTSPLRVEYAKSVLEEVRARAVEGFYKLARGGVEVAGVLIGEQHGDTIRILAQHPFEIEYAFGPTFLLSPRDQAFLRKLLDDLRTQHAPLGHKVLGIYISHSRGELSLTETDLALFSELFPHSWQTVLVLKPSRAPEMPAAFFVREPNGMVRSSRSHLEFDLEPGMGERRARPEHRPRPEDPSLRALASASTRQEQAEPVPAIRQLSDPRPAIEGTRQASPPPLPSTPNPPPLQRQVDPKAPAISGGGAPAAANKEAVSAAPLNTSPPATLQQARTMASASYAASAPPASASATPAPASPALAPQHVESASSAQDVGRSRGAVLAPPVAWEDEQARSPRASSPMRLAIPAVGVLLLAVLGYLIYLAFTSSPPQVVFYTKDFGDRVEVVWQLSGIRDATSAMITIERDGEKKSIDLMRTGQLSGSYTDPLLTADARVTLDVQRNSGPPIQRVAPLIDRDSPVASLGDTPETTASLPTGTAVESAPSTEAVVSDPANAGLPAASAEAAAGSAGIEAPPTPANPLTDRAAETRVEVSVPAPSKSVPEPIRPREAAGREAPVQPTAPIAQTTQPAPPSRGPIAELPFRAEPRPTGTGATQQPSVAAPPPIASPEPAVRSVPAPTNQPVAPAAVPTPAPTKPLVAAPKPVAPKPAAPAAPRAGRVIWTGQLRKNQMLQVNGADANQGALNAALPGQPVRLNVLPGELTPQGLVVYTANPRYRNAANAVEEPGPTNGWNRTQYRYDPLRANSIIVTAIPNQTNRWQGITVRNDDKTVNVIVIDWLADAGN